METIKLPGTFTGKGEVKGFLFEKINESEKGYIYSVKDREKTQWYEVFKKKLSGENPQYVKAKTGNMFERYPKAKSFGYWAWTFKDLNKAVEKFNTL
jgi:hypothetical protein